MHDLVTEIQSGTKKKLFGRRPIFEQHAPESEGSLARIEAAGGFVIPSQLRQWLLAVGSGDLDETLSIRSGWLKKLDATPLTGHIVFAQDELGNFYTIAPDSGAVSFLARSEYKYAAVAQDFRAFISELIARNYNITGWADALPLQTYQRGA